MSSLPFRLLAITPPTGEPDPRLVDAWLAAGAAEVGLAVLLRTPSEHPGTIADDPRLLALRRRCAEKRLALLLSCSGEHAEEGGEGPDFVGRQLRGDPDAATLARARVGDRILGRSIHAPPVAATVDYSVFAPVFSPNTPSAGAGKNSKGIGALNACAQAAPEPIFALGGVTAENAGDCLRAGAWGLAGISAFFGPIPAVVETVAAFVALLRDAETSKSGRL